MPRLPRWLVTAVCLALPAATAVAQPRPWMLGPFEKPRDVNPVVAPSPVATLRSPLTDSLVQWEGFATFNPAAVVRDAKVMLLYRAEDATGVAQIGGH